VDALSAYMVTQNSLPQVSLLAATGLSILAAYTHAVLRNPGFRTDLKVKLDDRAQFMNDMKSLPLVYLIQSVYPDLYAIHDVAFVVSTKNLDNPGS
jgi:protein transport protein SEC24